MCGDKHSFRKNGSKIFGDEAESRGQIELLGKIGFYPHAIAAHMQHRDYGLSDIIRV